MKSLVTTYHNIGPFKDFTIDFESIKGPLIALVAKNGTGKTFALEAAWFGTAFRKMRTQGALLDRAKARDSYLKSLIEADDGERYTVIHRMDPTNRKGESVVFHGTSTETVYDGKGSTTFDAWAEKHLPTVDVLRSTNFAVQGSSGILGMTSSERISVVLQAVGMAQIERMAEFSRKKGRELKDELKVLSTRITDARDGALAIETARARVTELEKKAQAYQQLHERTQRELDIARQSAGDSALAKQRYIELKTARDDLILRIAKTKRDHELAVRLLAEADVDAAEAALESANSTSATAKETFSQSEKLANSLRIRRDAAIRQSEDRLRVQLELERANGAKAALVTRIAKIKSVLDDKEKIRTAATEAARMTLESQACVADSAMLTVQKTGLESSIKALRDQLQRLERSAADETARIGRLTTALANADEIRDAVRDLPALRKSVDVCTEEVANAERLRDERRSRRIAGADERVSALRGGLVKIRETQNPHIADETLEADDAVIVAAVELPGLIAYAESEVKACRDNLRLAEEKLRQANILAAQEGRLDLDIEALSGARWTLAQALCDADSTREEIAQSQIKLDALSLLIEEKTQTANELDSKVAQLRPLLVYEQHLDTAEAKLGELEPQLATVTADVDRLTEELEALPEPDPVPADPDVAQLRKASEKAAEAALAAAQDLAKVKASREHLAPQVESLNHDLLSLTEKLESTPEPTPPDEAPNVTRLEFTCKDAQEAAMAAARELGEASQRVEQALAADERATALESERALLELELADWTRLSHDLGRDGIQSAEVDSAGPELTELTNDLLLKCHGPRYSVRISTKRVKADGVGEVDECLILVTDHEKNETKEGKEHSGGEKVIIGEAVSLALTMMACRRSRAKNPILIRDETGAALDPINARVYIAMLRHAAKFTHAEKIIFVSHSKEVQAMADAVITIGNDTVELEGAA